MVRLMKNDFFSSVETLFYLEHHLEIALVKSLRLYYLSNCQYSDWCGCCFVKQSFILYLFLLSMDRF